MAPNFGSLVLLMASAVRARLPSLTFLAVYIYSIMGIPSPGDWGWLTRFRHTKDSEDGQVELESTPSEPSRPEPDEQAKPVEDEIDLSALSRIQLLPGELRQMIYNYTWEHHRVLIGRDMREAQGQTKPPYKLTNFKLPVRDRKTHRFLTNQPFLPPRPYLPPLPLNLMLSCKSMYNDMLLQFYARTQFVFESTKSLRRFLDAVRPEAKAVIRHVELRSMMYNEPQRTADQAWKAKRDAAWLHICERMAEELPSLQVLFLDVTVFSVSKKLQVGEPWSEPYLAFCDRENGGLEWVDATVRSSQPVKKSAHAAREYNLNWIARLSVVSNELERRLMTDSAYQKKLHADFAVKL